MQKKFKIILAFLPLIILIVLIILLAMVIYIYKTDPDYGFILSQKIRRHAYLLSEEEYNKKFDSNKKFGEFCYRFFGDELNSKKIRLSLDEQIIRGSVYANGDIYEGKVDPKTLDLIIGDRPATWHWRWHNWLGIGLDKVYQQTLEEMIGSPLPVKKNY